MAEERERERGGGGEEKETNMRNEIKILVSSHVCTS